jgi:hypothetical protein
MILRSPAGDESADCHDRHAGMDGRHLGAQDASRDIHVAWIPALHAGMTELISRTEADLGPPPFVFSKEKLGRVASGFLTSQYAFGWLTVWPLALLRRNILIA